MFYYILIFVIDITFLVFKMGLTILVAQPVSILIVKSWKVVMKCKIVMFFNFWAVFSQNVHF